MVVSSIIGRRTIGQLVLGWVTVCGRACNKPPMSTQPPTPCGRGNELRPKCGDDLRLEVKAGWLIPFVIKRVGDR